MCASSKILVVSEQWWPEGTGGILASHLIACILRDAGFKLTVVHGTEKPEMVKDVDYVYTKLLRVRNKHRLWINCFVLARQSWFSKVLQNCDVVYIPRYCYPLIPLAKKLGKRVVVHLHDYQPIAYNAVVFNGEERNSFGLNNVVRFEVLEHGSVLRAILGTFAAPVSELCRLWLSEANTVVCVSRRQAEIISNRAPQLADKIRVVYNPLPETPPVEEKLENPTFTYTGGGSYVKGFYIFIRASLNVLKRGNNASFMLTGGLRGLRHKHIKLLEKLSNSLTGSFKLLGHLPYEDVLRLYSRSHTVLVPSIWEEPLPYVVMEATAMGTIPVASRVGGIPEIVEGTYAERMMFTPGNVGELVDRMEEVLSLSRDQLLDIGASLRESVLTRFAREEIKERLVGLFAGLHDE